MTPPPPPDKVANGLVTTPEAQLGAPVSPAAPTVAEVERIAALTDPVVRNLQITQCYWELSRAFAARTGGGPANWCTFATWASKQAGQTIRREDLARTFERLFAQSSQVTSAHDAAVASMAELSAERGPQPIRDAIWKALEPSSAFDRASDAIARGNRKVFEEIGREFARLLALPTAGGAIDPTEFESFRDSLRPGDPPDGQGYLRQAFTAYAAAFRETDVKERAELTLLANLAIGWHEQTRLQPQIAEALDAPFEEPVKLRRDLLRYLLRLRTGFALRLLLDLIPGRSTSIKKAARRSRRWRQADRTRGDHRRADDARPAGRGVEPRSRRARCVPGRPADDRQPRTARAARAESTRRRTPRAAAERRTGQT